MNSKTRKAGPLTTTEEEGVGKTPQHSPDGGGSSDDANAARSLMSAKSVRERGHRILAEGNQLRHFVVHRDRLDETAAFVLDTIRLNYPDLKIPFHARWRHFIFERVDRWAELAAACQVDARELARIQFDLSITSVLLDAGAGPIWRYRDTRTGQDFARSEGLALASLDAFADGLFSSVRDTPLRADAAGLTGLTVHALGEAFQVAPDNELAGLSGRAALMQRLGETLRTDERYFAGNNPRIGNLFDWIVMHHGDTIAAPTLLEIVLDALGTIWPGRLSVDGINLGDTWRHPAITTDDATNGLVPFHKLSQWLTYSLIEPMQDAGVMVTNIDGLTGLAEYRNGGLFVDMGVLELRDPTILSKPHQPGDELIVEWRALTVALLDLVAERVRDALGRTVEELPLASILEGGTWSAGRRIANQRRPDGSPPIQIVSDGSVF